MDKKKIFESILYWEPEMYEYPYVVNRKRYFDYVKLIVKLQSMRKKELCDFKYENLYEPYLIHCIDVTWNVSNAMIQLEAKEIAEICSLVDSIVIDVTYGSWQLSSAIYEKA